MAFVTGHVCASLCVAPPARSPVSPSYPQKLGQMAMIRCTCPDVESLCGCYQPSLQAYLLHFLEIARTAYPLAGKPVFRGLHVQGKSTDRIEPLWPEDKATGTDLCIRHKGW